jgi:hypothetical protein
MKWVYRLNIVHIIKLCRIRFYFHLLQQNNIALYNLFYVYFADYFNVDDCLILVFLNHAEARSAINEQFCSSCSVVV